MAEPVSTELWQRVRASLPRRLRRWPRLPGFRQAAVLLPLMLRKGEAQLILIRRSAQMRHHAGQIAFPGGTVEAADSDRHQTAVRETCEELGVDALSIDVLGRLPEVPTLTGFQVTPLVARLAQGSRFSPCADEVAEVVEVPLDALLAQKTGWLNPVYTWQDSQIWGVTAFILRGFLKRLRRID